MKGKGLGRFLGQQGVVLIVTALLLPIMIAGIGGSMDLGDLYSYKVELQNAADSAALAGVAQDSSTSSDMKYRLISVADLKDDEGNYKSEVQMTLNDVTYTLKLKDDTETKTYDEKAADLVNANTSGSRKLNLNTLKSADPKTTMVWTGKPTDSSSTQEVVCYLVKLAGTIPTNFVRYFGVDDMSAEATAVAVAYSKAKSDPQPTPTPTPSPEGDGFDLLMFRQELELTNILTNPFENGGTVRTTFNGRVSFTDGTGIDNPNYSGATIINNTDSTKRFYSDVMRGKVAKDEVNNDPDNSKGQWTTAEYRAFDYQKFWKETILPMISTVDWNGDNDKDVDFDSTNGRKGVLLGKVQNLYPSEYVAKGKDIIVQYPNNYNGGGNTEIYLNTLLDGDVDKPLYIIFKNKETQWGTQASNMIRIRVTQNTSRPVIIVVDPTSESVHPNEPELIIDKGCTFRGLIYMPTATRLIIHNNGTFYGSIVANNVRIHSEDASFYIESYDYSK